MYKKKHTIKNLEFDEQEIETQNYHIDDNNIFKKPCLLFFQHGH